MPVKNHYETLEISESANADEIKKAYRKLSLRYHPDKNGGDLEATKMFQSVSEAYEILGDKDKKQQYDAMRHNPFSRMNSMGGNGFDPSDAEQFHNVDELFSNLFFGGMAGGPFGGIPGQGIFANGFPGGNIRIFKNGAPVNIQHAMQKPAPIVKTIFITMQEVLVGAKLPLEIERWTLENNTKVFEMAKIYIDVFKGIDHNEVIIVKGEGNVIDENNKGDVKVFVNINKDPSFDRNGLDLLYIKNISLKEALCGFSFDIKYINGKVYTINNQSGNIIPPEYQKVIPKMGLTRDNHTGNLIIIFKVEFPEKLTPENIAKIKEIL
jgi:DnaJ-class molecular chaperone